MDKVAVNMLHAVQSSLLSVLSADSRHGLCVHVSSGGTRCTVLPFLMGPLLQEVKTRAAHKGETGDALMALERRRKPPPAGELLPGTAAPQAN